jgi:hypothetical protein
LNRPPECRVALVEFRSAQVCFDPDRLSDCTKLEFRVDSANVARVQIKIGDTHILISIVREYDREPSDGERGYYELSMLICRDCAKLICSFLRDRDRDADNACAGWVGDGAVQLGAIDLRPNQKRH